MESNSRPHATPRAFFDAASQGRLPFFLVERDCVTFFVLFCCGADAAVAATVVAGCSAEGPGTEKLGSRMMCLLSVSIINFTGLAGFCTLAKTFKKISRHRSKGGFNFVRYFCPDTSFGSSSAKMVRGAGNVN